MRARRKNKHEWRLLGARGRNKCRSKVKKKAITEEQAFFITLLLFFKQRVFSVLH